MSQLHDRLAQIVGNENLFTDPADTLAFSAVGAFKTVPMPPPPLAVARPRHPDRMRKVLEFCSGEGIPVRIRGAGTAFLANATTAAPGTLIILTTGLDRLEIDAEDRIAHAQAGVTCAQLAEAAAKKGLFYPPDPGSMSIATIGGVVAVNAAGPRALKYGSTLNYLQSLNLATATGENFHCAAQNGILLSAGFPVASLFCGSMGALGVITSAVFRLLPAPQLRMGLIAAFSTVADAAGAVSALMEAGLLPAMLELLDAHSASVMGVEKKASLFMEFDGHAAEVADNLALARDVLATHRASAMRLLEKEDLAAATEARYELPVRFCQAEEPFLLTHASCPVSRLSALVEGIERCAAEGGLRAAIYGHAGLARLHVALFHKSGIAAAEACAQKIFALELMLNNAMAAETEACMSRKEWQATRHGITAFSRKLRALCDPAGIFAGSPLPGEENVAWITHTRDAS